MSVKQTYDALVARGIDLVRAQELAVARHTLASLQQKDAVELARLGLQPDQIEAILDSARPEIPPEVVRTLLWESRRSCVVCRGANRSVVIHHIEPWATSRSHAEGNLVVLCLEHHGEAHTTRELSLNLSAAELRADKARWLREVRGLDAIRVLQPRGVLGTPTWDYLNYARLQPVFDEFEIDPSVCRGYEALVAANVISAEGAMRLADSGLNWRLQHIDGDRLWKLMAFITDRMEALLARVRWLELPARWSQADLRTLAVEGTIFVDYGGYRFQTGRPLWRAGQGQSRSARRTSQGITVTGVLDAYDALSTSAYTRHLCGHHRTTAIGVVRGVEAQQDRLSFDVTFLSFGTGFGRPRSEAPPES